MQCPYCKGADSKVRDTRSAEDNVRRRRECGSCGRLFTTYERMKAVQFHVTKRDGRKQEFDRKKLLSSIRSAFGKRPISTRAIDRVMEDVERRLHSLRRPAVPTVAIGELVMGHLRKLDLIAYIRWTSVYRKFQDLENFAQVMEDLRKREAQPQDSVQLSLMDEVPAKAKGARARPRQRPVEDHDPVSSPPDGMPYGNPVIRIVGIGGGGSNAVNRMFGDRVAGVEYFVINTDIQHLAHLEVPNKLAIGQYLTRGLGAGGNPSVGRKAAEESLSELEQVCQGADMVFLACGMGGGTGTGAVPVVAQIAKESGALTVAVVSRPFSFEMRTRRKNADEGIRRLRDHVDTVITIPNDRLLVMESLRKNQIVSWDDALRLADSVLKQGIQAIAEVVMVTGEINVDFADVRSIMKGAGPAWLAIGSGTGENRALDAARVATQSPLLDIAIEGAKRILFVMTGGPSLALREIQQASSVIEELADPEANVIFGTVKDPKLTDEVKITLVATSFPMPEEDMPEREEESSEPVQESVSQTAEEVDVSRD